jgi:hypothetical protein
MREREGIKHPPAPFLDPLASLISRDGLVDHSDNGEYYCRCVGKVCCVDVALILLEFCNA